MPYARNSSQLMTAATADEEEDLLDIVAHVMRVRVTSL